MKTFISLFVALIFILPITLHAQWTKKIKLKAHSFGTQLSDFQVLVELKDSTFDFNAADSMGSDIRFSMEENFSGTGMLHHWTEEFKKGDELKAWVKIPKIPAMDDTVFYLHYGNPAAMDVSNGDSTFNFFDHFEGSVLNVAKWKEFGYGSISVQNSYIRLLQATNNWDKGVITDEIKNMNAYKIKSRFRLMDSVSNFNIQHGITDVEGTWHLRSGNNHEFIRGWNRVVVGQINSSGTNKGDNGKNHSFMLNEWYKGEAWFSGTEKWTILDTVGVYSDSNTYNNDWMGIAVFSADNETPRVDVDWIFVRKFHEPDVDVDVVEDQGSTINEYAQNDIKMFPNPNLGRLSIKKRGKINANLFLITQQGKELLHRKISGHDLVEITLPDNIANGTYILKYEENGTSFSQPFILSR